MKTIGVVILTLLLVVASFALLNMSEQIKEQRSQTAQLSAKVNNLLAADLLTSKAYWYFVEPGKVSSKPYGEGLVVTFDPGQDMYYCLPSRYRFPNEISRFKDRRISFARAGHTNDNYLVAGQLLSFEYLDGNGFTTFHPSY